MAWWKRSNGDRRAGARRGASLRAVFRVMDAVTRGAVTEQSPGRIADISREGCCLEIATPHLARESLQRCLASPRDYLIELDLQPVSGGTWRMAASVRWIQPETEGGLRVGLRFEDPVALPASWQRLLLAPATVAGLATAGSM